jgi:hypothetical protein
MPPSKDVRIWSQILYSNLMEKSTLGKNLLTKRKMNGTTTSIGLLRYIDKIYSEIYGILLVTQSVNTIRRRADWKCDLLSMTLKLSKTKSLY